MSRGLARSAFRRRYSQSVETTLIPSYFNQSVLVNLVALNESYEKSRMLIYANDRFIAGGFQPVRAKYHVKDGQRI